MKLVNILAENLSEWPKPEYYYCNYSVDSIMQDPDKILYVHYSCDEGVYRKSNEWCEVWYNEHVSNLEVRLAEDHATAIVTKQMWLDVKAYKEAKEQTAKFTDLTKGSIHLPKVVSSNSLDPNSTEYKIAVMQHYLNGGDVEVKGKFEGNDGWEIWTMSYEPQWSWHDSDFRIKLEPVEPTYSLPEIPWDVIEDKYKWFAFDGDEYDDQYHGYLYTTKPEAILDETGGYWEDDQGDLARVEGLKFNKGNAPWHKSLVKRPE